MDTAIQNMMNQIALWWQSVAMTFVDGIALFLPKPFGGGTDPLYDSYYSTPFTSLARLTNLFSDAILLLIALKIAVDAFRLYMARDAGELIISPTVFIRRVAITVIFALSCGQLVNLLNDATKGTLSVVRIGIYDIFHPEPTSPPLAGDAKTKWDNDRNTALETYPDVRTWVRNIGCWLTLPNNQAGGLLNMQEGNRLGVPCVGAVAGSKEVTLRWLPPDPWVTYDHADNVGLYNDHRDYWVYRSDRDQRSTATRIATVHAFTAYTDKGLTDGSSYYYWIETWCYDCNKKLTTGPLQVIPLNSLLEDSTTPAGRILLNVLLAVSLGAGVIAIVLQTAFRSVEIVFAKMVGPIMALSAMNTDEPWSQGAMSLWLREVAVLVLSQITQLIVLCALVSTIATEPAPNSGGFTLKFNSVVMALVLITIGTQGPRILRSFAWSGDAGKSSGLGSQFVSRIATKLPW